MVLIRRIKSSSGMVVAVLGCRYRPETAVELGLRRKEKQSLVMRESQCLDTVLNCVRDFMGTRIRISVNRSEFPPTLSAAVDDDEYSAMWRRRLILL